MERGVFKALEVTYLGLGGNIGDTAAVLLAALGDIAAIDGVEDVTVSRFYETTPVSSLPQADYVNAVCRLMTTLPPSDLFRALRAIEQRYGEKLPVRNAPRVLDIDILFYGTRAYQDEVLTIPHPRWHERLFVLRPLCDLVDSLTVPNTDGSVATIDLNDMIATFHNPHNERVQPYH